MIPLTGIPAIRALFSQLTNTLTSQTETGEPPGVERGLPSVVTLAASPLRDLK